MSERQCEATNLTKGYRCQRLDGHAGAHMHGLDSLSPGITAWGWAAPEGLPS